MDEGMLASPASNGNGAAHEEEERELKIGEDGIKMLGYLSRKPTKESQNKKAHGRYVFVVFHFLSKLIL